VLPRVIQVVSSLSNLDLINDGVSLQPMWFGSKANNGKRFELFPSNSPNKIGVRKPDTYYNAKQRKSLGLQNRIKTYIKLVLELPTTMTSQGVEMRESLTTWSYANAELKKSMHTTESLTAAGESTEAYPPVRTLWIVNKFFPALTGMNLH